jgi:hypothetical protein
MAVDLWIDDIVLVGCSSCPGPSNTPTNTLGVTDTFTPTRTNTATSVPGTNTFTATLTQTRTNTLTNTPTNTSLVPTNTPTATNVPTLDITNVNHSPSGVIDIGVPGTINVNFNVSYQTATHISIYLYDYSNMTNPVATLYDAAGTWGPGAQSIQVNKSTMSSVPSGNNYVIVVFGQTGAPLNQTDTEMTAYLITIQNSSAPTFTPTQAAGTVTPTPTEANKLEIIQSTPVVSYPNPVVNVKQDISIQFAITKKAKQVTFRLYTSASRLIREITVQDTKVTNQLNPGLNSITISKTYLSDLSRGTYYYVIIVQDAKGNQAKSSVEKIVILK